MSELYLMHHGRLGQKWGKKNGPPYPLDYSKLSEAERKEAKDKSIREGDVKTAAAYRNRDYYTDVELSQLMNRFNTNQRLSEINQKNVKSGLDKAEDIARKLNRVADIANKGTNFYNTMAKIANTFGDTELPIIGAEKKKNNKEEQPEKKISFKQKDIDKILKNIDKYSDDEVQSIKKRADNIDQLRKKQFRGD